MKATRNLLLLGVLLGIAASAFAAKVPKSYILNSKHDFTVGSTFEVPTGTLDLVNYAKCNFCHVTHKFASDAGPAKLLWNHELSAVQYGIYSNSDSLNAVVSEVGTTDPATIGNNFNVSNMCLSCHDGTIAVADTYVVLKQASGSDFPQDAALRSSGTAFVSATATLSDLSRTHPVNFTFDGALATEDGGLVTPQADGLAVDASREIPLYNGKLQCGSCHDPHNGSSPMFARQVTNAPGGSFCLVCHL